MNHASARMPPRTLLTVVVILSGFGFCQTLSAQFPQLLPARLNDIAALGDESFQVRQAAAQRLLDGETDSFDWLLLARHSRDQEIARKADRLLQQIDYERLLVRLDPSLSGYRSLDFAGRAKSIIRLGQLAGSRQQQALVLIARFELDEVLSRCAAVELIESQPQDNSSIRDALANSRRPASNWIIAWCLSSQEPARLREVWQPMIDQLMSDPRCGRCPGSTSRLLKWYAGQLLSLGHQAASDDATLLLVELIDERPGDVIECFDWLLLHDRFSVCNQLISRFAGLMDSDARLLFRRAEMIRRQSGTAAALPLAQRAREVIGSEPLLNLQSAINLRYAGLDYWSEWQLNQVIENAEAAPTIRVQACLLLAEMQYVQNDFLAAASTLEIADGQQPVTGEPAVALLAETHGNVKARRSYFLHLHAIAQGDDELAEQHLLNGISLSPENSDLLIAMSRFQGSVDSWQEDARQLIDIALRQRLAEISRLQVIGERDPRQNRLREVQLAQELNGYAWLSSQSGFDLLAAEKFAREAAQLAPHDSRILDTLASCLFNLGKYREAVAIQQQAVRHNPNSLHLRAGLNQYRQAMLLAELPNFFR